jgi:hypothetical protein
MLSVLLFGLHNQPNTQHTAAMGGFRLLAGRGANRHSDALLCAPLPLDSRWTGDSIDRLENGLGMYPGSITDSTFAGGEYRAVFNNRIGQSRSRKRLPTP